MEYTLNDYVSLCEQLTFHRYDKVDVIIFYPPNESMVGDFVCKQLSDLWKESLSERRGTSSDKEVENLMLPDWKKIDHRLHCDDCEEDILPEDLKLFSLDILHLYNNEFLDELKLFLRQHATLLFLVTNNKMLTQWELISRFFYLHKVFSYPLECKENMCHLISIEDILENNFLFSDWKFVHLFSKVEFGTLIPGIRHCEKQLLKEKIAIFFSDKAYANKFRHPCYSTAIGYSLNSDEDYDTVDKHL